MDPNSSLRKICLGENVVEILSDKVEGSGDWDSPEYQDTANSRVKKETKAMAFHKIDTEENMISNEYEVKLCLEHEVKRGNKVVKKELIVALKGEIYFVKFIINLEEDGVEPGVIFERSFLRMTKAITDFGAGTITIYPNIDPFLEDTEEEEKSMDDWDQFLDFNLDDIPLLGGEELSPFVCKMGKVTEEAAKEALALRISQKFALLEEVGVTTLIAKFLILDIPIDCDAPIVVDRGFLYTIGGIVNNPERLFLTFDGFCHQTFCAARSDVLRTTESDRDDEEEYEIKINRKYAALHEKYGRKHSQNFETVEEVLLPQVHHEFLIWEGHNKDAKSRDLDTTMLRKLIESEGRLIPEDPQSGVPRGAYNPPGYAQPQYDQYYQQYPPSPPQQQQQDDDE
nr:hypothetical protein [Tanacetum cinerariifolium]